MDAKWTEEVDDILAGDLAVAVAQVTPARGVVIMPMAPMGLRDRAAGTVTLTTSLGLPHKVARLRRQPAIALAYHAREHGYSALPHFVLVQGTALVDDQPDRAWLESITPAWSRFLGPRHTGPAGRLMDIYYWRRLRVTVRAERIVVQPGSAAEGATVFGTPLSTEPPPQTAPKQGTEPRVDTGKVARDMARLPHTLLGWVGADGLPTMTRVRATGVDERGIRLRSEDGPIPQGGRRAGLTSHAFLPRMVGQEQRVHTGWLEVAGDEAVYAPHTRRGYRLPASEAAFVAASAIGMRAGFRKARKLGLLAPVEDVTTR